MYINQANAQLSQNGERHGHVIYKRAALARGGKFATQDALPFVVLQIVFFKVLLHAVCRQVETCFDDTFGRSCLDAFRVGTLAKQQSDGTKDNGFSRTRLTRNNGKAALEVNIEAVDECVVLYVEVGKHYLLFFILFQLVDCEGLMSLIMLEISSFSFCDPLE